MGALFGILTALSIGLGDLFGQSMLGLFVFGFQMSLTFGAVQICVAVLSLDKEDK